jgi:hypothetical protein
MKKYWILYGNNETEEIKANDLLSAQKAAHKKAAQKKTMCIWVTEIN